jgi:hypothetical protein
MSKLTDFAAAQFSKAREIIGGEEFVMLGETLSVVLNEVETTNDEYQEGGFPLIESCIAVASLSEWSTKFPNAANTYVKKIATVRSQSLRVQRIRAGQSFVTIELRTARKG